MMHSFGMLPLDAVNSVKYFKLEASSFQDSELNVPNA